MDRAADVIIVGGGLSGLTCGAILAGQGHSVLVLEKHSVLGGRARCIDRDGWLIDYGIHFCRFAEQGPCAKALRAAGLSVDFRHPGPPLVFRDGVFHRFPRGPADMATTTLLSLGAKVEMLKLAMWAPLTNPWKYYHRSLADWLRPRTSNQQVLELIRIFTMAALVCPDLERVSSREVREFLKQVALSRHHLGYPKGGWKPILQGLANRIRRRGEIGTSITVEQILVEGGELRGVRTDQGEVAARSVVCTLPFGRVASILDLQHVSSHHRDYAARVEPTAGITLEFGLRYPISSIDGVVMTLRPPTMGCFVSNVEPLVAPAGRQLGSWLLLSDPATVRDRQQAKRLQRQLEDLLEQMFPGLWAAREWSRPMFLEVVDGAEPTVGQTWTERAALDSGVGGLYFAGDSTCGRGLGGDIAFNSAVRCAELVQRYLRR